MPMQHASDTVLARMRRPERQRTIREKLARIREVVPGVAVRTTCIVGFPGETDEDFETLMRFLEEVQFDRVGAFTYSAQEGTRAAEMDDDVPPAVKRERLERLNELQRLITSERLEARLGTTARALVDSLDERGVMARVQWQADDIDGVTWIRGPGSDAVSAGSFVDVRLEDVVDDYDFAASLIRTVSAPPSLKRSRALPMAGGHTMGSWGR
jgi:ribosomal protein S12 methylthiotransferase